MMRGYALKIAVVVLGLLTWGASAQASTQSITITPTSVPITIAPGVASSGDLQVLNQGEAGYDYTIYTNPYSVSGESYDPDFSPIPGATDVSSWFSFTTNSGHLAAGQQSVISYHVLAPIGTKPGGYYAVVFAQTRQPVATTGVTNIKRVGAIFYLKVAGNAVENGQIASWQVPWLQTAPLSATLRLANDGSVHYEAAIHTLVSDVFGGTKYRFDQTREILPQTIRRIVIPWGQSPSFGLFKVSGNVGYLGQVHILPDHYVLVASHGTRLILLGLIVIAAVLVIVLGRRREKPKTT